jgi:hypothetical protein
MFGLRIRALVALLRPTAYAIRWAPPLAAAGFGLALVAVPSVMAVVLSVEDLTALLRIAAIAGALGAAFLLDDPATGSTAVAPTSRLVRHLARVGIAVPVFGLWWGSVIAVTHAGAEDGVRNTLPLSGLTVEAAAILALAVALAAVAVRRSPDGTGAVVAAPGLLVVLAVLRLLPERVTLFVVPDDPRWVASHDRWAMLLAVAFVGAVWASCESRAASRRRWSAGWRSTRGGLRVGASGQAVREPS